MQLEAIKPSGLLLQNIFISPYLLSQDSLPVKIFGYCDFQFIVRSKSVDDLLISCKLYSYKESLHFNQDFDRVITGCCQQFKSILQGLQWESMGD